MMQTRPRSPKLRIGLRHWAQLERLCDQRREGPVHIQLRSAKLTVGASLPVLLALPNGFEARLRARVVHLRPDPRGDTPELTLELTTLSAQIAERLRALATPAEPSDSLPHESESPSARSRVAAGTPPPEQRWPGPGWQKMLGEIRGRHVTDEPETDEHLKLQIDELADRMRRRD